MICNEGKSNSINWKGSGDMFYYKVKCKCFGYRNSKCYKYGCENYKHLCCLVKGKKKCAERIPSNNSKPPLGSAGNPYLGGGASPR